MNIQKNILRLLSELERYKGVQHKVQTKFEVLREVLINNLCFGHKYSSRKRSDIGEIPEHWDVKKLEDITTSITKGTTPSSVGHSFVEKGINFVKVESITSKGSFIVDKFEYITESANEVLARSKLKPNDILFSIAGALGRSAIVPREICPANTNQALSVIRLKEEYYPLFFYYFLKTNFIINGIGKLKVQAAQPNLSLKNIREFKAPIPPYHEQVKIADEIMNYERMYNEILKKNLTVSELDKKISNKVF